MRKGWLLFLTVLMVGCSDGAHRDQAREVVKEFHADYQRSDFAGIYTSADEALRRTGDQASFVRFLSGVRSKLGGVKHTELEDWVVTVGTSGVNVALIHDTQFEQGSGRETFTVRIVGDRARLLGYNLVPAAPIQ